jgi:hypothetical protein
MGREQQRHIDRHAGEYRLFDGGEAFRRAGYLDVQIGAIRLCVDTRGSFDACARVVRKQRRDLHRHPPIDAVGCVEGRAKQIGGPTQVFERQLDKERFDACSCSGFR